MTDFLHRLTHLPTQRQAALLPSPYAAVLRDGGRVRLVGPHDGVLRTEAAADALLTCAPNVIKAMAGRPAQFVGAVVGAREVPLLRLFEKHEAAAWPELLRDLRSAVDVTDDERQFEAVWRALTGGGASVAAVDQRQAERLCRRYAGQAPSRIRRQLRLAAQLAADISAGAHRPLGDFADHSHYIREARAFTGRTPRHWRASDAAFCAPDGAPVPSSPSAPAR